MLTIEQLKELTDELNRDYRGLLKFKVRNRKTVGTGIGWIGVWGKRGPILTTNEYKDTAFGGVTGKYQGFGRTDEEFVEEVKKMTKEIVVNLVESFNNDSSNCPKFTDAMKKYLKANK